MAMSPCPRCGNPLQWVAQYNQWWCAAEQQYLPPGPAQAAAQPQPAQQQQPATNAQQPAAQQTPQYACPGCGQALTWVPQYNQWYCYAEQRYYPPSY